MDNLARACTVILVVIAVVAGAGCADDPEERRAALARLVVAFGLEREPDEGHIRLSRVRDTNGYPYYVATGVLDAASREEGVARVVIAFEREGW